MSQQPPDLPLRLLLLEDDELMRDALRETLADEGYEVVAVGSGVEAVEAARLSSFDLVVADVRMAGMDGLTALEHVKEHTPGIRSLVVSGYCDEADTLRALRLGAGDFLRKPFQMQDLLDSVRRLSTQRRLERERKREKDALLGAATLALESLALIRDASQPGLYAGVRGAAHLGQWARQVALDRGFSPLESRHAEIAALHCAMPDEPRFSEVEQAFPQDLRQTLEQLRRGAAESPLAQLVMAVLRFAELDGEVQTLVSQGVKPELVETLSRLSEHGLEAAKTGTSEKSRGQQRRGMLSLGLALEGAGDHEGAGKAFAAVLEEAGVHPQSVEATLALARLARVKDDGPKVLETCRRALDAAAYLGPHTSASTSVECAFLAFAYDKVWSIGRLRAACEFFDKLGQSSEQAKARLALWAVAGEGSQEQVSSALRELSRPAYGDELASCARWLAPALLERASGLPAAEQALFGIARLFPGELQALLALGRLSSRARVNLIPILGKANSDGAQRMLRSLAQDSDPEVQLALRKVEAPTEAQPMLIRLTTLGSFEVYRGESRIPNALWHRSKNRLLFARLAAATRPIPEEALLEEFWPGDPRKGKQNIYAATSTIKRCLAGEQGEGKVDWLQRSDGGLMLSPSIPFWHDLKEVDSEIGGARSSFSQGHMSDAFEKLKRVHRLYKGPYMESCYDDWAGAIRQRLERQVTESFQKLCGWLESQGRGEELGEFARWLLSFDACCLQANFFAMRSYLLTDRPQEAVRHFEKAKQTLARELEMEPSIDMLREHQRALMGL